MKVTRRAKVENDTNDHSDDNRLVIVTRAALRANQNEVQELRDRILTLERDMIEVKTLLMRKRQSKTSRPKKIDVWQDGTVEDIKEMLRKLHPDLYR